MASDDAEGRAAGAGAAADRSLEAHARGREYVAPPGGFGDFYGGGLEWIQFSPEERATIEGGLDALPAAAAAPFCLALVVPGLAEN